jgi:mRNA-degrading endonuclease RelE of RelBE toxin-antitoxin system
VNSYITSQFRQTFGKLPENVREQTREAYRQFKQNPNHPSLRFKKVHPELPIYSARVSRSYRAVGQLEGDKIIWFWLGTHTEYDKLLSQM